MVLSLMGVLEPVLERRGSYSSIVNTDHRVQKAGLPRKIGRFMKRKVML